MAGSGANFRIPGDIGELPDKLVPEPSGNPVMDWTIGNIITLVATTGILSAVLTQFLTGIREGFMAGRTKKALAGYHALRLAVILEGYAYACATFISENNNAQLRPEEQYPDWNAKLPDLLPYPEETEGWHAIDLKLAGRALDLRNHITGSQGMIGSTVEFCMHELGDILDEHGAERGQEAWTLAVDLRRKYGLAPFEPIWDFTETLERARRGAQSARYEREREQEELIKALRPST
jgi:hypothetical protein